MIRAIYCLLLAYAGTQSMCEQTGYIYLDHLCGPNIDFSQRITCTFDSRGVYTSRRVYENVQVIQFERFPDSILNLETFPNITQIYIKSITETTDGCQLLEGFKRPGSVEVRSDQSNWTCSFTSERTTTKSTIETTATTTKSTIETTATTTKSTIETTRTIPIKFKTVPSITTTKSTIETTRTTPIKFKTVPSITTTKSTIETTRTTPIKFKTVPSTTTTKSTILKTTTKVSTIIIPATMAIISTKSVFPATSTPSQTPHNTIFLPAVTSTSALAVICIVAAVILAICLKYKIIELKKITVGKSGVGIEFSRRHILEETTLSEIKTDQTPSAIAEQETISTIIGDQAFSTTNEEQTPSDINEQALIATDDARAPSAINEQVLIAAQAASATNEDQVIMHSTPVAHRTRSKT